MLAALIPVIGTVLDKIFPDANQAAEAKLKVLELSQKGELAQLDADLQIALAQSKVNEVEAASPDLFRGGWRPSVGWMCVAGLLYDFIARPMLPWIVTVFGKQVPPLPAIDTESLMVLLIGLLGLGGMRTFERIKGKA